MDSSLCGYCQRESTQFCACASPGTFLCERCVSEHIVNNPALRHAPMHLNQLPDYKIPGFFVRLKARQEAFPRVQAQVWENVTAVEKLAAELIALEKRVISEIQTSFAQKRQTLNEARAYLCRSFTTALEEVEKTLTEDKPRLNSLYGPMFRHRTESPGTGTLQIFFPNVVISDTSPASFVSLEPQILRPNESYRFAWVSMNQAYLYETEPEQLTQRALSVYFKKNSSFMMWDMDTLLCLQGGYISSEGYLLSLSSFLLSPLPSFSIPRVSAGLARMHDYCYAFGGWNGKNNLSICEKIKLSDPRWTVLKGQMAEPRALFTPCHFRTLIYLIWAKAYSHIETFEAETETFAVLPVILPSLLCDNWSSAFVYKEEIVLITASKQIARWRIETEREFRLLKTSKGICSLQQPLIVGSRALFPCEGAIQRFNLDNFSFSD